MDKATSLVLIAVLAFFVGHNAGRAEQRKPAPVQPGQAAPCWEVIGTTYPTVQCADGKWQVTVPDGTFLVGTGPLPGEYQPIPAENEGTPPLSQFAPGLLFNIPTGRQ